MGRHSLFTLCELVDVMTQILLFEEFSHLLRIGGEKFRQSRIKYIDSLHRFIFWERIYHLRTLLFIMTFHLTKGALSPKVRHEVRNWQSFLAFFSLLVSKSKYSLYEASLNLDENRKLPVHLTILQVVRKSTVISVVFILYGKLLKKLELSNNFLYAVK